MTSEEFKQKEFILLRLTKKIFISGLTNILPTFLVIAIFVVAYNFLNNSLGGPINTLIKNQLATNWKNVAIKYLDIDDDLYKPLVTETYEELVRRVQDSSISFHEAKMKLDDARTLFEKEATQFLQKKEGSNDPEYIKFLEQKIEKIRISSGLDVAQKDFERENIKNRSQIAKENEIRLAKLKWGDDKPEKLKAEIEKKYPNVIGLIIAFLIIFFIGMIITTFVGRTINNYLEKFLTKVPIVRKIYPYTKQLTQFLFKEKELSSFKNVVAVEYPKHGIYSIAFPTGGDIILNTPNGKIKKIILFIPSSPTPFTGWTIMADENEIIPLNISVEEAIRFLITGGVIKPNE